MFDLGKFWQERLKTMSDAEKFSVRHWPFQRFWPRWWWKERLEPKLREAKEEEAA